MDFHVSIRRLHSDRLRLVLAELQFPVRDWLGRVFRHEQTFFFLHSFLRGPFSALQVCPFLFWPCRPDYSMPGKTSSSRRKAFPRWLWRFLRALESSANDFCKA